MHEIERLYLGSLRALLLLQFLPSKTLSKQKRYVKGMVPEGYERNADEKEKEI